MSETGIFFSDLLSRKKVPFKNSLAVECLYRYMINDSRLIWVFRIYDFKCKKNVKDRKSYLVQKTFKCYQEKPA